MNIEGIREYYEMEYKDTLRTLINPYWAARKKTVVNNSIQRCLGVAFFAQGTEDVTFQDIDELYQEYKEKFERILR